MNIVSIRSIQSTKNSPFFCYLYSSVGVSLIRFQQQSADIFGLQFSTVPPFNLGNILMEFLTCSSETVHVFSGKNSSGNAENEVSVTCYTAWHLMMKLAPAQFRLSFPLFHGLESFCRRSRVFCLENVILY